MAEHTAQRQLLDDIREFIDQKWTHSACELCGTDRWMVYPDPTPYAYLSVADERSAPPAFAHPMVAFLPVTCVNCGNLRLVDARVFEKWREARSLETTKSSP